MPERAFLFASRALWHYDEGMRVALVHDYLTELGGAERVLEALCQMFPHAPIYTLLYDEELTKGRFCGRKIYTSFLQKFPLARTRHRAYAWLMPIAVEQFDLGRYDLVISDSASYAKGIVTKPSTLHVSYCHTPIRYAWDDSHRYVKEFRSPRFLRPFIPLFLNYLRLWDKEAALRPDAFVANSHFVRERIRKYYGVEAEVIYPPVDTVFFGAHRERRGDYFLAVGRLLAYKRFDLAIQAFNAMRLPLKIAGEGPEYDRLRAMAGPSVEFLGRVSDEALRTAYGGARALIFAQEEDFGITAVEAMAAGTPVIAYRGGGALETVQDGVSGVFFDEEHPDAIRNAVGQFLQTDFDASAIQAGARDFDTEVFKRRTRNFIGRRLHGGALQSLDAREEARSTSR